VLALRQGAALREIESLKETDHNLSKNFFKCRYIPRTIRATIRQKTFAGEEPLQEVERFYKRKAFLFLLINPNVPEAQETFLANYKRQEIIVERWHNQFRETYDSYMFILIAAYRYSILQTKYLLTKKYFNVPL